MLLMSYVYVVCFHNNFPTLTGYRGNGYTQVWKQDGWLRDGSTGKPCWYIFGEDEATQAREAGWQLELVAAGMSHVNGALLQYDNNYYVGREVTVHFIKVHVRHTRDGQPVVRAGDQRYARAHVAGVHPWLSPTMAIDGKIAVDHLRVMTKRKRSTMDTAVVPSSFPPHDYSVVKFAQDFVHNYDTPQPSDGAPPNPTTAIAKLEFTVFLPKGFLDTVAKTLMFERFELDVINMKHKALVGVVRPFAQVPPSNELQNELRSIVKKSNQDRPDGLDVHATAAEIRRALHGGCRDFALLQQVEGLEVVSSEAHRFAKFVEAQGTMHKLGLEGNAFLQQVGRARNPPQELALEMLPGTGGCPEKTTAALCTVLKMSQTYEPTTHWRPARANCRPARPGRHLGKPGRRAVSASCGRAAAATWRSSWPPAVAPPRPVARPQCTPLAPGPGSVLPVGTVAWRPRRSAATRTPARPPP